MTNTPAFLQKNGQVHPTYRSAYKAIVTKELAQLGYIEQPNGEWVKVIGVKDGHEVKSVVSPSITVRSDFEKRERKAKGQAKTESPTINLFD